MNQSKVRRHKSGRFVLLDRKNYCLAVDLSEVAYTLDSVLSDTGAAFSVIINSMRLLRMKSENTSWIPRGFCLFDRRKQSSELGGDTMKRNWELDELIEHFTDPAERNEVG
jgi:hypothetical protein